MYFLIDGAPSHVTVENLEWMDSKWGLENVVSRHTKKWERYCAIMGKDLKVPRMIWPANSPDLSGLDFSIWDRVKKTAVAFSQSGFYESKAEARACVEKAWDALPQDYIGTVKNIFILLNQILSLKYKLTLLDKVLIQGMKHRLEKCKKKNGNFVG